MRTKSIRIIGLILGLGVELHRATGEKYYRVVARSAANAAFDFPYGSEGWYSLVLSPLYVGLNIERQLKGRGLNCDQPR